MSENALEVQGICKHYDKFELQDISFTLPKGYIMGYVGQNGSGKTTTLNIIARLIRGDGGKVTVDGLTYKEDEARYRDAIGYIGSSNDMIPDFTLKDIRRVSRDFYPSFDVKKFDSFVERWSLPEKKKIKDFSKGMRVKTLFAQALSRETKLLILDEATNGLDPVVRQKILELLQEYISDGEHSVLFSTHILSDLEDIADYIFFIENGKKVFCGVKEELQESYVLVKGGPEDIRGEARKYLIGPQEGPMGFEALAKSDDTVHLPQGCLFEKPSMDKIVVHMIEGMEGQGCVH